MLKKDKLLVKRLASTDDEVRVAAAGELDQLEKGHFEDHPVSMRLIGDLQPALVAAHVATSSALVKQWITQVLADGHATGTGIDALVLAALTPGCSYLPTLLYYMWSNCARFEGHKEQIKTLCGHADEQVRWRCALILYHMPLALSYDTDAACLRALALDAFPTARTYAVLAMARLGVQSAEDVRVLRRVVEIDEGAAAVYAQELLAA